MLQPRQPLVRTQAFTLVEVLLVVAIIGIAGAVIVPQMLSTGTLTIQGAGRMVISDLLYAQNEAIAHQSARRVVFDLDRNLYKLTDAAGNILSTSWKAGSANNYIVDLEHDRRFAGVRLESANFASQPYVEFDALGAPSQGGAVELVNGPTRYRITVAPMTGRVTIAPVPMETGG